MLLLRMQRPRACAAVSFRFFFDHGRWQEKKRLGGGEPRARGFFQVARSIHASLRSNDKVDVGLVIEVGDVARGVLDAVHRGLVAVGGAGLGVRDHLVRVARTGLAAQRVAQVELFVLCLCCFVLFCFVAVSPRGVWRRRERGRGARGGRKRPWGKEQEEKMSECFDSM